MTSFPTLTPESDALLRGMIAQARAIEAGASIPPTPPTTLIIAQARTIVFLAEEVERLRR